MSTLDVTGSARTGVADYTFIRRLGEASHGDLWLADAPPRLNMDNQQVAIKILHQPGTADGLTQLAEELARPAGVRSAYLSQLVEAGHHDGTLYYVTDYSPNGSLAVPARPLSRVEVLQAVANAARGAHALHEVGIAHRNIRPSAVVLSEGNARLGDFGLTQPLNPGQTITGVRPVISIEYLAPEVVRGEESSRATDIWSLGATLHRSLTGKSIFPDLPEDSLLAALRHVLNERVSIAGPLSGEEQAIIAACIEVDPADRPATAEALAERIDAEADRQAAQ